MQANEDHPASPNGLKETDGESGESSVELLEHGEAQATPRESATEHQTPDFWLVEQDLLEYQKQAAKLLPMHSPPPDFAPDGQPQTSKHSSCVPSNSAWNYPSSSSRAFASFPTHSLHGVLSRLNEEAAARWTQSNEIESLLARLNAAPPQGDDDPPEEEPRTVKPRRNKPRKVKNTIQQNGAKEASSPSEESMQEGPRVTAGEILRFIGGPTLISGRTLEQQRTLDESQPLAQLPTIREGVRGGGSSSVSFEVGIGLRYMKPRNYKRTAASQNTKKTNKASGKGRGRPSKRTASKKRTSSTPSRKKKARLS